MQASKNYFLQLKRYYRGKITTKVLYIISDKNFGGGSRHVFDLIINLDKNIFTPILISIPSPILDLLKDKTPRFHSLDYTRGRSGQVKTYSVEMNSRLDLKAVKAIQKIIKKEKPDIIHLHSTRAGILGTMAAKKYKIPIVYTEHLFTNEYIPHSKLIYIYQLNAFKFLSKYISKVIAVSNAVKQYLVDKKVFISRQVEVIYNGVNTSYQPLVPTSLDRDSDRSVGAINNKHQKKIITIGSIGTLTKIKGYKYLIDAVQNINNAKLEIIGSGPDLDLLKDLDKNKKVKFSYQIKDPGKIISNWDIYIQPSLSESFGLALAEAMSLGLPVIATRAGGIPELVDDAGLLVAPNDGNALKDAIIKLINDSKLREDLGKKAKVRIQKYFTLEKMVKKTENLYQSLL